MSDAVQCHRDQGVLRVQLNRPDKRNALTLAMYQTLAEALEQAEQDDSVRVLVLHGSETCFTAGNDLQDFLQAPPTGEDSPVFRFLLALSGAGKPLVAAVNGAAVGIGTTLLLHCDLIYCGRQSRFQLPFVDLGLVPEAGSSLLLPALTGHPRAAELLLLGEPFGAGQARTLGLVNEVLDPQQVLPHALEQARKLAAKPPAAVRRTKALLRRAGREALRQAMAVEGRAFVERLRSPEAREALNAFLERRPADFSRFR